MKHIAFIGLGSNLANPSAQVLQAMQAIDCLPETRVLARSSLYRSAPVGYLDQPDFINAVVRVETALAPLALLQALLALEQENGRTREFQNAPRTLDLDVLLYDEIRHHQHGLTLPHPQMHKRAFVLQPLLEIAPGCVIPGVGAADAAMQECRNQQLEKLEAAFAGTGRLKNDA
ncbi:MAG: 2-amino-4-hydroxy-6-hydroxymethyldihydropteridine diphosphokinase [Gallionellales bacterium 35-53-114]|jgi:2-amino-4-hydroxy-6-hydroxymethyldihydropteridine diphosphokinase|nr:MAG: 2-amino-4-hydroxy-6-hydroxymethyldihydropteridine diphosphokinase [Gallionellales bacterium 35-53-114]OYZ63299.1 MAG: 2-amino-4-hydroxy-6-hydroxymethyldihydropteridine diphosphokinase [Gallionellales bacterium 24-53-125]OZB08761.1 MAG: 2-amino-4-hydroxy-6-hydroxymethyldihydropteridine diphosphokinase [Gallionellales bacterium 39-52-133]HQS57363.1 2-amino-4-hydroxy-6-hydroxymethyldihydropteridine diphosphokinase [Gallionellaceae bacterium]HQS74449.1 2-amino-4-hydroxy-6-hydroxymethyldihyd